MNPLGGTVLRMETDKFTDSDAVPLRAAFSFGGKTRANFLRDGFR